MYSLRRYLRHKVIDTYISFFDIKIFFVSICMLLKVFFSKENDNKFSLTYEKKKNFICNLNDEQGIFFCGSCYNR